MNEQKKDSLLSKLSPGQVFGLGLGGGILVLCTIGFFILLTFFLKNGTTPSLAKNTDKEENNAIVDPGLVGGPKISDVAKSVGLAKDAFKSCVENTKFASKIQADEAEAQAAGGQGTPYSIIIGPKGETIPVNGAQPFAVVDGVIKKLLGQKVDAPAGSLPTAQTGIKIRPADDSREFVRGNKNAKITVVEFSDMECPFCKRFHQTMQQVLAANSNDIKWVYRHFPLDGLHPKARTEALMTECAGEQGKFWEFLDGVFKVTPSNNGMDITL